MSDREHAYALLSMVRRDLKALQGMTDARSFADEIFGFHAQQAAEKALKAWIAARGEEYPLTHSIAALLALLEKAGCDVRDFWDLTKYSAFAVQFRYETFDLDEPPLDRRAAILEMQALFDYMQAVVRDVEAAGQ